MKVQIAAQYRLAFAILLQVMSYHDAEGQSICNLGPRAKRNVSRFVSPHFSPNICFMSKTKQHNINSESTKFQWGIHEFEFYALLSFMSSLLVFFSSIVSSVSNFVSECFCICAVFCLNISVFTLARTGGQLGPPHKGQILLAL